MITVLYYDHPLFPMSDMGLGALLRIGRVRAAIRHLHRRPQARIPIRIQFRTPTLHEWRSYREWGFRFSTYFLMCVLGLCISVFVWR